MALQPLDQRLDAHDLRIVEQALRGIVDLPDIHRNVFVVTRDRDTYRYSVEEHAGAVRSPLAQPFTSPNDITPTLLALGYLTETGTAGRFAFTDGALAWYRRSAPPTDREIQHRLGVHLLSALQNRGPYGGSEPLDLADVARTLRVPPERLIANARTLELLGYVKSGPADQMTIEEGYIFLTAPRGVAWANDGAQPLGPDGNPAVGATDRITLDQLLDRVERPGLAEQDKERIQTLLTRLERDKRLGRDMVPTVKDLLDAASNSRELLPAVLRFAADQVDDAQRTPQRAPGS